MLGRRRFMGGLAVVGLVASLLSIGGREPVAVAAADARPNVVVILTDDQTLAQMSAMPQTRALIGGDGLTFTDAVVSYPLCCPSRATLLTGQYTQNNGVRSNTVGDDTLPLPAELADDGPEAWPAFAADAETRSLAVALQASGYRTGLLGKYLNGYRARGTVPPGWTDWRARPGDGISYGDTQLDINGTTVAFPNQFQTDLYADQATDMIEQASAATTPFFLLFSFSAPHTSTDGKPTFAERHADLYDGELAPRGPSFNEGASDKPPFLRRYYPRMRPERVATTDQNWRAALRSLAAVDEAVTAIVQALEETGELDDTVLVFTSDNGLFYGEHRLPGGKFYPYESSVRVPLLIRGPVIPKGLEGTEVDAAVANVDLAPTILDLAGVEPLAPVDGRSLRPLLVGDDAMWEAPGGIWDPGPSRARPVYVMGIGRSVGQPSGQRRLNVTYSGVRSSDGWLYVRWQDAAASIELYNLLADPNQLENLAGDPAHAAVQAQLEEQRRLLSRCSGRSCDVPPFGYLDLPTEGDPPDWFESAQWGDANGLGVAFANGTFAPRDDLRRDHAVLWLWRSAGSPEVGGRNRFTDVQARLWPAVAWAVDARLVRPQPPAPRFRPAAGLTRGDLAVWLWELEGRPAPPGPATGPVRARAIRWARSDPDGSGPRSPVIEPFGDGTFRGEDVVTRATAIVAVHRTAR